MSQFYYCIKTKFKVATTFAAPAYAALTVTVKKLPTESFKRYLNKASCQSVEFWQFN